MITVQPREPGLRCALPAPGDMTCVTPKSGNRHTSDRHQHETSAPESARQNRYTDPLHTASADRSRTFAVNNLRTWFAAGEDTDALLPVLQAYMGHSSISDTAYYLRLTAESYPQIAARVQREYGGIVPPATGGAGHGD